LDGFEESVEYICCPKCKSEEKQPKKLYWLEGLASNFFSFMIDLISLNEDINKELNKKNRMIMILENLPKDFEVSHKNSILMKKNKNVGQL